MPVITSLPKALCDLGKKYFMLEHVRCSNSVNIPLLALVDIPYTSW